MALAVGEIEHAAGDQRRARRPGATSHSRARRARAAGPTPARAPRRHGRAARAARHAARSPSTATRRPPGAGRPGGRPGSRRRTRRRPGRPVSWRPRTLRGAARPPQRCAPSASTRVRTAGDGHAGSATQRPGRSAQLVTGPIGSCMKFTSTGSSKKPFAAPLSAWSKKRTHSCRNPIAGPGAPHWATCVPTDRSGRAPGRRPARARAGPCRGTRRPSRRPRTPGTQSARSARRQRALGPVVVAALVGQPRRDPLVSSPPTRSSHTSRQRSDDRRFGRLRGICEHAGRPWTRSVASTQPPM